MRFENYLAEMIITTRRCVVFKNHVARSKVKVTVKTYSLCIGISSSAHNFIWHGGFENYMAQMIIKARQFVLWKNNLATSKINFTVSTYSLCTGLNETYLCPAHNFIVGPALGMVQYRDLVFHPFIRSYQGTVLLNDFAGASVSYGHIFSSFSLFYYYYFCQEPAQMISIFSVILASRCLFFF